jgi:protease I
MASELPLSGKRILIFVGDIYEDLELWYPKLRLIEAGAEVTVGG